MAVCERLAVMPPGSDAVDDRDDFVGRARAVADEIVPLGDPTEREAIARAAVAHMHGLGPLERLLADPHVDEVMINNGGDVWVDRCGSLTRAGRLAPDVAPRLVERILSPLGRRLDRLSPIVDGRLADGSRICAVIPPVAIDGACLSVRRFGVRTRQLTEFAAPAVADLLTLLVERRCNVLISGATSSGKTSLLNALASRISGNERVITLEDTAELRLDTGHVLRLETRPATADGVPGVTMTDLVRTALRLRPDRLVVGEIRGAEVIDMLQALNTGHSGSLSTCHANNPIDAVRRVAALLLQFAPGWPLDAVDEHIRSSIDVIVHVTRDGAGRRSVSDVIELSSPDDPRPHRPLVTEARVVGHPDRFRP